jgi:GTP cyclohydrolase I
MGKLDTKIHLTINDCNQLAANKWSKFGRSCVKAYPIPKGGHCAAVHFLHAAKDYDLTITDLYDADCYIDDIVDTGATYRHWKEQRDIPIMALIDQDDDLDQWYVFPWEREEEYKGPADVIKRILSYIGEDPNREGLINTPKRVVDSFDHLYSGYHKNPDDLLVHGAGYFEDYGDYNRPVLLKDIDVYSTCEHHMLPFFGKAHIAYLPNKKVIGVSKLARLLEIYARRLQIQERIGEQVTKWLMVNLECSAALCILECQHFCMTSRGVEKQNAKMVTSSIKGAFMTNNTLRQEVMELLRNG